jgi:hypothetical protein
VRAVTGFTTSDDAQKTVGFTAFDHRFPKDHPPCAKKENDMIARKALWSAAALRRFSKCRQRPSLLPFFPWAN